MAPTSALLAFMFLSVAASLNVPTCPPVFKFITLRLGGGALIRQSEAPIDVCPGLQDAFGATFGCSLGDQPLLGDCLIIDDTVVDNLIRPLGLFIPPLSGVVVTLFNNTCAFVFSNNDSNDTYEMELECIPDALLNIDNSESCRGKEQGPAFGLSVPSPDNPNGAN
ncbi:hypothetical protein GGX14DRAFT_394546 [Mycena pura]|uniref:Uncharacterized protein n=1 Tax=Mycena pura TaxID=153505 RepID=A0AAD6VJ29_9AGAR|nr:hypothetical protein GGX14DRAFT_394546 [Mycena pura]